MVSLFSDWENDTVVAQRYGAGDGFGARQPIGDPFPLQVQLEETSVRLRNAAGVETLSTGSLYATGDNMAAARTISPGDQLTLPDGRVTEALTVTVVAEGTDLDGVTVTVA